jgi:tRNA(Ile)-lysidine synthetase-like protein
VLRATGAPDGTCTLAVASPAPLPPGLDEHRRSAVLRVTGPLTVRTRRRGERVRLAAGSRPVATLLAEAGVPRALRDRLPVVADATDRALWVPGVAVDSTVHVGPAVARH